MRVVLIGATGHIGTYLVPRLVESGHEVIAISRSRSKPYLPHGAWNDVTTVQIDRNQAEKEGEFGGLVADLRPDAVIDLICFTLESAEQLVNSLNGKIQHLLHCGSIWVHGPSAVVPITEEQPRKPFGEYGIRKAEIENYLLNEAGLGGFPATILHPGHIVGPGWVPLNPSGNFNPAVFEAIALNKNVTLPNFGMETIHHVHADDVAQGFMRALSLPSASIGESFHIVSPNAITLNGYAHAMAQWFGSELNLTYLPWNEWKKTVSEEDAAASWDHIKHSPSCSIEKACRLIGYNPRYSSIQAIQESVTWLINNNVINATIGGPTK